jgi:hypothetical protein
MTEVPVYDRSVKKVLLFQVVLYRSIQEVGHVKWADAFVV